MSNFRISAAGALGGIEGLLVLRQEVAVLRAAASGTEAGLGRPGDPGCPGSAAPRQLRMSRIVTPDTLLRWHWTYFHRVGRLPVDAKLALLIEQMAWGKPGLGL